MAERMEGIMQDRNLQTAVAERAAKNIVASGKTRVRVALPAGVFTHALTSWCSPQMPYHYYSPHRHEVNHAICTKCLISPLFEV